MNFCNFTRALMAVAVSFALTVHAGESDDQATTHVDACYKLVQGKQYPMCREFTQNLNKFCNGQPLACSRKIDPAFAKDFSFPKWEALDPAENLSIVAEGYRSNVYSAESEFKYASEETLHKRGCYEGREKCLEDISEKTGSDTSPKS